MRELTRKEYLRGILGFEKVDKPRFLYKLSVFDPDGRLHAERYVENLVTRAGVTQIFNATFKGGGTTPWFVSLIQSAGAPTFATTDTMASHAGWTEITGAQVSQTVRQTWTPGTISSGTDTISVDNSAASATYNVTATITLQGLFLVDNNVLGGTSGNLYGEAAFGSPVGVSSGFVATVTGTCQLTAG